jgi:peptide-methionine (S)-S-oxide reductase
MPLFAESKTLMPEPGKTLPGRPTPIPTAISHYVNRAMLTGPYPEGSEIAMFGLGCFWGAEKAFWSLPGVHVTAAGYSGGATPNPTYEEVCTGETGHAEVVRVVYDPKNTSYGALLKTFWEAHDPTQHMRQGADIGTQYRSAIYTYSDAQAEEARASRDAYQAALSAKGYGAVATEITPAGEFYFAEDYHQQYLAKNPQGYCGHGGTGVSCPIGQRAPAG